MLKAERGMSMKKRILSVTITALMMVSLSGCGIISDETKAAVNEQFDPNYGKGSSEIEVVVDAYLSALKNADMEPLEKYLDENINYKNTIEEVENSTINDIDIKTAEYAIIREFEVNGVECLELEVEVDGEGIFLGKFMDAASGSIYVHKAGPNNYWFYGAPAE